MANDEANLGKTVALLEETTRLLRDLIERVEKYREQTISLAATLPADLLKALDLLYASHLRTIRWHERQVEDADTRPDNMIMRRDPTPAFGVQLPQLHTAEIRVTRRWWERALSAISGPGWAAIGAALSAGLAWLAHYVR